MQPDRIYNADPSREIRGNVVYWMSREQRVSDNWPLLHALELSKELTSEISVVFTLVPGFLGAAWRQYDFMLKGLRETERELRELKIPFRLLAGDPVASMLKYLPEHEIGTIVTDFDPLKTKRHWKNQVFEKTGAAMIEVDGHNIVPARMVSKKTEFGAYTLRPKIHRNLDAYLDEFPDPADFGIDQSLPLPVDWEQVEASLRVDRNVQPVDWIRPGAGAAAEALGEFISNRLDAYAEKRNDPNENGVSGLSPYLHFGQLSSQRVALEIIKNIPRSESTDAFLEELIVRKELSDNFCFYNPEYDNPEGFHDWAKKTHAEHARDERAYLYSSSEFEQAKTHDPLWNAAQTEMVKTGKMHGYMRMYWAKKILEWTPDVAEAMRVAIWLNDKYELDGRDPNGYTGIAWSMGGVHDRAWQERPVFGKIRYMNYNGCKRKFNVESYIEHINNL